MEAQVSDLGKTMQAGEPPKTTTVHRDKTLSEVHRSSQQTIEDVEMRGNGDENMDIVSPNIVSVAGTTITEEVFGRVDLESGPSDQADSNAVDVLVAKGNESLAEN
ncbi:hypothetical protein GBA52_028451 [Prunus armeniaca]|nr:hypothetical protein GBA52_028451 [Prunus armeniaca]